MNDAVAINMVMHRNSGAHFQRQIPATNHSQKKTCITKTRREINRGGYLWIS